MLRSAPDSILQPASPDARILVVDDTRASSTLLPWILEQGGYQNHRTVRGTRRIEQTIDEFEPHLVLLDVIAPSMDAFFEFDRGPWDHIPALVLSNPTKPQLRARILARPGTDYLGKPFDEIDVLARSGSLLRLGDQQARLAARNRHLVQDLRETSEAAEKAQIGMLARLATIIERRSDALGQHNQRVAGLAGDIALALGQPPAVADDISYAARLHDVGKIVVPDRVLLSSEPLNDEDFALINTHTTVGARILSGGVSRRARLAESIALTHHERWDGTGYPHGLAGTDIPLEGRIVAVADAFDAITDFRPYRDALSEDEAIAELRANAGTQFDPAVVEAFVRTREGEAPDAPAPHRRHDVTDRAGRVDGPQTDGRSVHGD